MSGIITEPEFLRQFPQMEPKNKSGSIQALVVAIYEIGCLIGAGGIIAFGDKLGRRRAVIIELALCSLALLYRLHPSVLHSSLLVAS
jgi:MFS family permease